MVESTEQIIVLGNLDESFIAFLCPHCKHKVREIEECEICGKVICDLCIDTHYEEEHYEA